MVARTVLTILSLALSACAFQVTQPNANQGWTSAGPNTVVWERVDTDPTSFAIVLTNTDRSVLPVNNQVLVGNVDATSQSSISITAPSGGFPVGGTFRVNLVRSRTEVNAIFAQSNEFSITDSGASTSSVETTTVTSITQTTTTLADDSTAISSTTSSSGNPSPSQSNLAFNTSPGALASVCSSMLIIAFVGSLA